MLRTNDKRQLYSKLIRASYMIAANNSRFVIELRAVHGKMQFGDVENAINFVFDRHLIAPLFYVCV